MSIAQVIEISRMNRPKTKAARELDQHNGYGKVGVVGSPIEAFGHAAEAEELLGPVDQEHAPDHHTQDRYPPSLQLG
jgi:hypothetical protein